jgi:predicted helicase
MAEEDIETTDWTELKPASPAYLFASQDAELLAEYESGWKITEVMNQNGDPAPGIVTTQDQFAISWTEEEARRKVERFLQTRSEDEARSIWRLCSQSQWNYDQAMQTLASGEWKDRVEPILYRPFDTRWTVYDSNVAVHRRERVMNHMLAVENLGIAIGRAGQVIDQDEWNIVFCSQHITEYNLYRRGGNNLFPLYLYPQSDNLFDAAEEGRRPNLSPQFVNELSEKLDLAFVPDGRGDLSETFGLEDVFFYAYAIFHSPAYRERYAEFLKRDFPRLPLTSDRALFAALAGKGAELVGLHLMTSPALNNLITRFPEGGDNMVEKVRYDAANERVYINKDQFFESVPEEVWQFRVGGYQVLDKWLKDRKGRALSFQDIQHYQRVVVALAETRRLMREIDETIPGWPLK